MAPIKKKRFCVKCEKRTPQWGTRVERKKDGRKFIVWECACKSLAREEV